MSQFGGDGRDDTIYLAAGVYKPAQTLTYDAKGTTEKISLVGCDPLDVVIDGQNKIRVMHFRKNGKIDDWQASTIHVPPYPALKIQGLTIQNGNPLDDTNKYGYSGGGILAERFNAEIVDTRFVGNRDAYEGGALNGTAHTVLTRVLFKDNVTTTHGGSSLSVCGRVTMAESVVQGSRNRLAFYRGVCLENDGTAYDVNINDTDFSENDGAVYVLPAGTGDRVTVSDSRFMHNNGVAVFVRTRYVDVFRSIFADNGYYPGGGDPTQCVDHDFYPCGFAGALGADFWSVGGGIMTVEDSEFADNYAPNYGGAIDLGGVRDCEVNFSREGAPCNPNVSGFNPEVSLFVRRSVFKGNRSHRGAAISIAKFPLAMDGFQRGNVRIEGGAFEGNVATAIEPAPGITPVDELETSIIASGGSVQACGVTFTDNAADTLVAAKAGYSTTCP